MHTTCIYRLHVRNVADILQLCADTTNISCAMIQKCSSDCALQLYAQHVQRQAVYTSTNIQPMLDHVQQCVIMYQCC